MLKILLFPLRLAVGWGLSPRLLGWVGILMLVLLRVAIGWHFYTEGIAKFRPAGSWSAAPFFANASGPLANEYRRIVWDYDGRMRLDRDKMVLEWAKYRDRVIEHFGFGEEQARLAQINFSKAVEQYDYVVQLSQTDIQEYKLGRGRVAALDIDPVRQGVSSLRGQREEIRREWLSKVAPVLSQIDMISENYEQAQNEVASEDQLAKRVPLPFRLPRTGVVDTSLLDQVVPYFDVVIGLCLLLGLFTPVAALAAAGFLGSVFLSQYPPNAGPGSTYYQLIEGLACLVLAGTAAGRFAGLDFFLHMIVRKVWGSAHASGVNRG